MRAWVCVLLLLACALPGCSEAPPRAPGPVRSARAVDSRPVPPALSVDSNPKPEEVVPAPPPDDGGRLVSLEVPARLPSPLWVPRGAVGGIQKPLVVSAHGAGGTPEAHCQRWRELVGNRAFVLCLRGRKAYAGQPLGSSRHYYPTHHWLARALAETLEALDANYGDRVDSSAALFSGYSQGAVMGALVMMNLPERFPRLLLVEAQQNDWSVSGASRWRRAGGRKVALACGLATCEQASRSARSALARGGVEVSKRYAAGAGHTYLGGVATHVSELLDWLVADDPRWAQLAGGGVR